MPGGGGEAHLQGNRVVAFHFLGGKAGRLRGDLQNDGGGVRIRLDVDPGERPQADADEGEQREQDDRASGQRSRDERSQHRGFTDRP